MSETQSEQNQEPTKTGYITRDGEIYWTMSDGTGVKQEGKKVPIMDTLVRPPKPGFERSSLTPATGPDDYHTAAVRAEESAAILRSGELGTGDRAERLAQVMDETAQTEHQQAGYGEFYLQGRHGDTYQAPEERSQHSQ